MGAHGMSAKSHLRRTGVSGYDFPPIVKLFQIYGGITNHRHRGIPKGD